MSRGESAKPGQRGPGLAIFAALGVLVIAAACVVFWSLTAIPHWLETMFSGPPPPPPPPGDPAGIAYPILGPLRFRECMDNALGPMAPSPTAAGDEVSLAHAILVDRGYAPGTDDPTPLALPLTGPVLGLDGSCGVLRVAVSGSTSVLAGVRVGSDPLIHACRSNIVTVGVCGGDVVTVDGSGVATLRTYVMPGVTSEIARRSGMPTDVLLAHGEAESWLRARGWEPGDGVIERRVAHGAVGRTVHGVGPGIAPPHGCIGWVVVGQGIGQASVAWGPFGSAYDLGADRFLLGMLTCSTTTGGSLHGVDLNMTDTDGGGGRLFFRPYHARTGPAVVGHGALAGGTTTMHVTPSRDIDLPTPIDPITPTD